MAQDVPGEQPTQIPEPQDGSDAEDESGAGYGNHAMPDVGEDPVEPEDAE